MDGPTSGRLPAAVLRSTAVSKRISPPPPMAVRLRHIDGAATYRMILKRRRRTATLTGEFDFRHGVSY